MPATICRDYRVRKGIIIYSIAKDGYVAGIIQSYRQGWRVLIAGHIEYVAELPAAKRRALEIANA
jgi:hypothetical protein